jgi:hypothetical protein
MKKYNVSKERRVFQFKAYCLLAGFYTKYHPYFKSLSPLYNLVVRAFGFHRAEQRHIAVIYTWLTLNQRRLKLNSRSSKKSNSVVDLRNSCAEETGKLVYYLVMRAAAPVIEISSLSIPEFESIMESWSLDCGITEVSFYSQRDVYRYDSSESETDDTSEPGGTSVPDETPGPDETDIFDRRYSFTYSTYYYGDRSLRDFPPRHSFNPNIRRMFIDDDELGTPEQEEAMNNFALRGSFNGSSPNWSWSILDLMECLQKEYNE